MPVGTLRRNDAVIMYLDRNPKGHSNYKFIFALLVGKVAIATISSSRLELNLNLNVAAEIRIIKGHEQIVIGGHHYHSSERIQNLVL